MSLFYVKGIAMIGGVPTNGLQCVAFDEARFPVDGNGNVIAPVLNQPFPDANVPDGGPVSSGESFGGVGHFSINVPDAGNVFIACFDPADQNTIAWEGPKMATPHTSRTGFTAVNVRATGYQQTSLTVAMDGLTLPRSTISVTSTAAFSSTGKFMIQVAGGSWQTISYTGTSGGNTFTGCTGGTGTMSVGSLIAVITAYVNGANRRLVIVTVQASTAGLGDVALAEAVAGVGGAAPQVVAYSGVSAAAAGALQSKSSLVFPVDPNASYAVLQSTGGGGVLTLLPSVETDF